jgi:hypothetical protein
MSVDAHVSRCYQDELAERAKKGNAILAMDTGTGKTMIAAMVIKWKLTQERMDRGNDRSPSTKRACHSFQQRYHLGSYIMIGRNISRSQGATCRATALFSFKEHDLHHSRLYGSNGCGWMG